MQRRNSSFGAYHEPSVVWKLIGSVFRWPTDCCRNNRATVNCSGKLFLNYRCGENIYLRLHSLCFQLGVGFHSVDSMHMFGVLLDFCFIRVQE